MVTGMAAATTGIDTIGESVRSLTPADVVTQIIGL